MSDDAEAHGSRISASAASDGAEAAVREPARVAVVRATGLLDAEAEEVFDRLSRLAVRLLGVPAAFLSLVDADRDFYLSACGFGEPLASARQITGPTFCHHALASPGPLVIPDTAADPAYRDVPTVRTLGVAAYVGVPVAVDGQRVGSFCAIDTRPRAWTALEVETMTELAGAAERELDLRMQRATLGAANHRLQAQQAELEVQAETLAGANANLEAALADAVRARRDADAARRQAGAAEAQLRSVFAQAPAAVSVTLGPEHRFVLVNPRAEEAVGRRDLVGQTYAGAFPEFAAQGFAAVLDRVYATGEPFVADEMRVEVPRPDGATEPRWYDFVYQPLRDAAGAVTGVLQHAVDVTPRVTARAALAAASAQLAERTAAAEQARRVAEDARRGAEEARRTAEEANAAKARFLANMSHELRTPLNAIGGHVQLVELGVHGPVSDAQRGALARVQAAQRHLLGLITDILDYAKVEGGRVEYDVRPVDAHDMVAAVGPLVEPLFRAKGLAYAVRLPDAPVLVWADRERLGQVLVNLLSNAAKFTDPEQSGAPGPDGGAGEVVAAGSGAGAGAEAGGEAGGEAVVVDLAERRTGPGPDGPDAGRPGVVFLRVRDAGRGIARDQQERVFEPFVQVGKRFAGDAPGTGLGLAISRDLARGMGGDLRVRSAAGEGSVFTVTLRRVVDVAGQPTDRRVVDERREDERRSGDDRRIPGAGHVLPDAAVGIPPALDRALAGAVLAAVDAGTATDERVGDGSMPSAVADAVARVAAALTAQGAAAGAVRLALEDAFAALLAGQRTRAARALQLATAPPDTAAGPYRPSGEQRGNG